MPYRWNEKVAQHDQIVPPAVEDMTPLGAEVELNTNIQSWPKNNGCHNGKVVEYGLLFLRMIDIVRQSLLVVREPGLPLAWKSHEM